MIFSVDGGKELNSFHWWWGRSCALGWGWGRGWLVIYLMTLSCQRAVQIQRDCCWRKLSARCRHPVGLVRVLALNKQPLFSSDTSCVAAWLPARRSHYLQSFTYWQTTTKYTILLIGRTKLNFTNNMQMWVSPTVFGKKLCGNYLNYVTIFHEQIIIKSSLRTIKKEQSIRVYSCSFWTSPAS